MTTATQIQILPETKTIATSRDGLVNRAFVLKATKEFVFQDRLIPELPTERHVIIAIRATGLCGSDIHYWQHGEIGPFKVRQPLVLGHESAGVVWRCGSMVRSLQPGDRVAVEPGIPCRACSFCKSGRYNLCPDVVFAATPPNDGTLTTYYTVPEDFCYKLPSGISFEEGALLEPLSVAVHCAKLGAIGRGSSVLVFGAGPIGLLCCAVARVLGACTTVIADVVLSRLEFARQYAASDVYQMADSTSQQNASNLMQIVDSKEGFDVVIDATGAQSCINTGVYALKRGGVFIQAGLGTPDIMFPIAELCSKEGKLIGSFRYGPGDYDTALEMLKSGAVQVRDLISHRYSFDEAEQAFQCVLQRKGIKVIVHGDD